MEESRIFLAGQREISKGLWVTRKKSFLRGSADAGTYYKQRSRCTTTEYELNLVERARSLQRHSGGDDNGSPDARVNDYDQWFSPHPSAPSQKTSIRRLGPIPFRDFRRLSTQFEVFNTLALRSQFRVSVAIITN